MHIENVKPHSGTIENAARPTPKTHNLKLEYRLALVGPDGPVVEISGSSDIPMALHPHHNLTACECCIQYFDNIIAPSFKTGNNLFFRERKLAYYKQQEAEEAKLAASKAAADLANGHSKGWKEPAAPHPDISSLLASMKPPFGEPPFLVDEDQETPGSINPVPAEPTLSIPQGTAAPSTKATGQIRKVA